MSVVASRCSWASFSGLTGCWMPARLMKFLAWSSAEIAARSIPNRVSDGLHRVEDDDIPESAR